MDTRATLEAFVETMSALMAVLGEETELLKEKRLKDMRTIQNRKSQLSREYAQHQETVYRNPALLRTLSEGERSDLRALYKRVRTILSDNMLALRAAHDSTDRVIKVFVETVRKKRGIPENPPPRGMRGREGYGAYVGQAAIPVAVDRQL